MVFDLRFSGLQNILLQPDCSPTYQSTRAPDAGGRAHYTMRQTSPYTTSIRNSPETELSRVFANTTSTSMSKSRWRAVYKMFIHIQVSLKIE